MTKLYPGYLELRQYLKLLSDPSKDLTKALRESLDELSVRQREFVEMYYIEQVSMRDIAVRCGVNISTVSRTIARAKTRMARDLRLSRNELMLAVDE